MSFAVQRKRLRPKEKFLVFGAPLIEEDEINEVVGVLRSGWIGTGPKVAQFEKAIGDHTLESCVHRFPVSPGDSILVQSGQIHAIDAGNLILEIQQNSDTTYRVYDWGRVGLDGKPRKLHVCESLRMINWNDFEPEPIRAANKPAVIADANEFRIRRVPLAKGECLHVLAREQPRLLSVVSGQVRLAVGDGGVRPTQQVLEHPAQRVDRPVGLGRHLSWGRHRGGTLIFQRKIADGHRRSGKNRPLPLRHDGADHPMHRVLHGQGSMG